jgi:hypothetical protein
MLIIVDMAVIQNFHIMSGKFNTESALVEMDH